MPADSRLVRRLVLWLHKARRPLALILIATLVVQSVSCGTIIHPERWGQPRTGPLDPSIVVLDGLGVLLFVIPGVVAFIVDFSTGAIYLPGPAYYPAPPGGYYPPPPRAYPPPGAYAPPGGPPVAPVPAGSAPPATPVPMTRIDNDPTTLDKQKIEAVVRAQTGRDIDLDASDVGVHRVQNVEDASRLLNAARDQSDDAR
jgi:hypothetical protein